MNLLYILQVSWTLKPAGIKIDRLFNGLTFDHFQLNTDKCYSAKALLVNSDKFPQVLPFYVDCLPKVEFVTKVQALELQTTDLIEKRLQSHWLNESGKTSPIQVQIKTFQLGAFLNQHLTLENYKLAQFCLQKFFCLFYFFFISSMRTQLLFIAEL